MVTPSHYRKDGGYELNYQLGIRLDSENIVDHADNDYHQTAEQQ